MMDLARFLTKICNDGADYILGWDANTPYDHDDIQDFLQDHDMVDAFSDLFDERPATHFRVSDQIDLISISCCLAPYVQKAYISSHHLTVKAIIQLLVLISILVL
jgi:hypothetical protein